MAMTQNQVETILGQLIPLVSRYFYDGNPFTVFGGDYTVVPRVTHVQQQTMPDGSLDGVDATHVGVRVTSGMLQIHDNTAIHFAVAHELGHGFTEQLMNKLGIGVQNAATEVIADLGAAYLLAQNGTP